MDRIDNTGPDDVTRERMGRAQIYADELGQTLTKTLPDGWGFFIMLEPAANGTGALATNMKPAHLARIMRKVAKRLPS